MTKVLENESVQAAIAIVIAASMQDKPVYKCHIEQYCDPDQPEELIAVLNEAAYYGVEVRK